MFDKFKNKIFGTKEEVNEEDEKLKKENEKAKKREEKLKQKEDVRIINKLIDNWQNTFGNLKNWNQEFNGYTLSDIEVHDYGCSARIYAPWGIDISDLEKFRSVIESGCKCEFIYNIPQHKQFAMAKFVYPEQVKINTWKFTPAKVKPWEFFCGYDVSGEPVIFNLNDTPQILDAGQQRRGKNGAIDHAIISWIHSCDEKELTLYLFQCAKNDLIKYKDCKQVYCYADTLDKILMALEHLEDELKRRTKLFESMVSRADGNDNIFHYNKLHSNNKIPYIIVVIDEFIELMPDNSTDDKETKLTKNKIMKYLQKIGQWGGALGLNYAILHQKPSKELMPTFIKNQSSIRICFGFEDLVCCAIVLGDELAKYAHKLPPRKAYFSNNEGNGYLYTSDLKGRIRMFIEPSIKPNHRTLFSDLEKLNKPPQQPKLIPNSTNMRSETIPKPIDKGTAPLPLQIKEIEKEEKANQEQNNKKNETIMTPKVNTTKLNVKIPNGIMDFSAIDDTKTTIDEKLKENIKNIPNYVPYEPMNTKIVIDQTNLSLLKTEKPKKKNKEE